MTPLTPPASALAIAAHPDDAEFGCGATLAKWASNGCAVHILVCTDGSKGTWDTAADIDALVQTRQQEQRAAHAALGAAGQVRFLGAVDGELDSGLENRREVARVLRELRPDVVLGHDPWKRYRLHPDHRHSGQLTVEGIVAARDPHFFPELGLAPHRPRALLLFEADEPDYVEDVEGFEQHKINALLAHRSQHESTMGISTMGISESAKPEQVNAFEADVRNALADAASPTAFTVGEAFKLIRDL